MAGTPDCIPNIGPGERRKRLILGIAAFVAGAALAAVLMAGGASRLWRVAVFVPLWASGLGFFQAFDKT